MTPAKPVRVMVVEDSPTVRALLCHIINADARLVLAGVTSSGEDALQNISTIAPDVVSMDVRLPGMDGLEATRQIMSVRPTPIVVIADSIHDASLGIALNALKAGALSVVEKPAGLAAASYARVAEQIATQLYIMSQVSVITRRSGAGVRRAQEASPEERTRERVEVVGLAASTGGPPALAKLLGELGRDCPAPIMLVQHMGAAFMDGFAQWLNSQTALKVKIAEQGENIEPGIVYVAPGEKHLTVTKGGVVRISNEKPLSSQRPSATLLFRSLAREFGPNAVGVLLTGMGDDGAQGLLEMRQAGAATIIEDSSTAVVFGMPGAAAQLGAARYTLPLDAIASRVLSLSRRTT